MDDYTISNDQHKLIYYNHGSMYNFYVVLKKWFSHILNLDELDISISTYSKAAERIRNILTNQKQKAESIYSHLVLDPTGDFTISDAVSSELYRYPTINAIHSVLHDRGINIYKDDYVQMDLISTRLEGTMTCTLYVSSLSEYLDYKLYFLQLFRNINRPIKPFLLIEDIIFEDDFVNLEYYNDVTKITKKLNWNNTELKYKLHRNIGKECYTYPYISMPLITLESINDSSRNKTLGEDIEVYSLELNIKFDFSIPSYLFVNTDYYIGEIHQNVMSTVSHYVPNDNEDTLPQFPDSITDDNEEIFDRWKIYTVDITNFEKDIIFNLSDDITKLKTFNLKEKEDFIIIGHNNFYFLNHNFYSINYDDGYLILYKKYFDNIEHLNFSIYIKQNKFNREELYTYE